MRSFTSSNSYRRLILVALSAAMPSLSRAQGGAAGQSSPGAPQLPANVQVVINRLADSDRKSVV